VPKIVHMLKVCGKHCSLYSVDFFSPSQTWFRGLRYALLYRVNGRGLGQSISISALLRLASRASTSLVVVDGVLVLGHRSTEHGRCGRPGQVNFTRRGKLNFVQRPHTLVQD